MDYENAVVEFREEGGLSDARIDLLRVLLVRFGTSWKSDLFQEIEVFRKEVGRKNKVQEGDVDDALQELEDYNLIKAEDRKKATREGGKADSLIKLVDFDSASEAFSGDEVLEKYRSRLRRTYGE